MLKEKISFGVSLLLVLSSLFNSCSQNNNSETVYLQKVLSKLSEIKSVSYYCKFSSSAPYDTLAFRTRERFVNVYINPADTLLGASFSISSIDKLTEFDLCYDGTYSVQFNWDNKNVQIDTLFTKPRSRPIAPFFIKAKSLVEYAIQNIDNSIITYDSFEEATKINFHFQRKLVEFMSLTPSIKETPEKDSHYELWVDKDYLPYKYIRKMPHQTSSQTCSEIKISNDSDYEFDAISKIPDDFAIKGNEKKITTNKLEGKLAPDWILKNIESNSIGLKNLKSKVIMIQFTGVGCGPCHHSLPFLKQLVKDFENKDFEFLAIETWSKNISGLKRYQDRNDLNFKFLMSTKEVTDDYQVQAVPIFFILDENRVIRNIVRGYTKGVTDKEIRKIINELI